MSNNSTQRSKLGEFDLVEILDAAAYRRKQMTANNCTLISLIPSNNLLP
jgi:hypothetical protein